MSREISTEISEIKVLVTLKTQVGFLFPFKNGEVFTSVRSQTAYFGSSEPSGLKHGHPIWAIQTFDMVNHMDHLV